MATNPTDPIVILSYARTPMGAMQGALADAVGDRPRRNRGQGGGRARGRRRRTDRPDLHGLRASRRPRPGALPARRRSRPACPSRSRRPPSTRSAERHADGDHGRRGARAGNADVVVAGGMESMTNAPYLLKKHRSGARIGHDTAYDHMFLDGLEDAYEEGRAMGTFAQCTADEYQLTREATWTITRSNRCARAKRRSTAARFGDEVVPVTVTTRKGEIIVDTDEAAGPRPIRTRSRSCKPAFAKDGTITAATSSSISDGAAAVVLTRECSRAAQGQTPVARIVAHGRPCAGAGGVHHRPGRRDPTSCSKRPAGRPTMSTCGKSTKPSPASRCSRCGPRHPA